MIGSVRLDFLMVMGGGLAVAVIAGLLMSQTDNKDTIEAIAYLIGAVVILAVVASIMVIR